LYSVSLSSGIVPSYNESWKKLKLHYLCVVCIHGPHTNSIVNFQMITHCSWYHVTPKYRNALFIIFTPHPINIPNYGHSSHTFLSIYLLHLNWHIFFWQWHCISSPAFFLPNLKLLQQKLNFLDIPTLPNGTLLKKKGLAQKYIKR